MKLHFELKGETPAKKNSRITLRNGKTIPGKQYQQWHNDALKEIFSQKYKIPEDVKLPIFSSVSISVTFVHGDKRRRDADNGLSSILDLLVDCNILSDDNWKIVENISVRNLYLTDAAGCYIEIEI